LPRRRKVDGTFLHRTGGVNARTTLAAAVLAGGRDCAVLFSRRLLARAFVPEDAEKYRAASLLPTLRPFPRAVCLPSPGFVSLDLFRCFGICSVAVLLGQAIRSLPFRNGVCSLFACLLLRRGRTSAFLGLTVQLGFVLPARRLFSSVVLCVKDVYCAAPLPFLLPWFRRHRGPSALDDGSAFRRYFRGRELLSCSFILDMTNGCGS